MEIEVERKQPDIDYHLEKIIEEMLKAGMKLFSDTRSYNVTLRENDDETLKETVTASFDIKLIKASDTLLEIASKEDC
jgi:predicted peroxiredoxin